MLCVNAIWQRIRQTDVNKDIYQYTFRCVIKPTNGFCSRRTPINMATHNRNDDDVEYIYCSIHPPMFDERLCSDWARLQTRRNGNEEQRHLRFLLTQRFRRRNTKKT